ncbi:hypothetical protein OJAV_G00234150 [Oryzias javanicus]|uniref:Uncharacterized protein n=1 Tax=Oryzias javanicus TaxID=123683 RepID=A0A3S2TUM0_ORYJA|nr:hypothetical protein OJAV_G00234150 [Oryzias javanicus]
MATGSEGCRKSLKLLSADEPEESRGLFFLITQQNLRIFSRIKGNPRITMATESAANGGGLNDACVPTTADFILNKAVTETFPWLHSPLQEPRDDRGRRESVRSPGPRGPQDRSLPRTYIRLNDLSGRGPRAGERGELEVEPAPPRAMRRMRAPRTGGTVCPTPRWPPWSSST